MTTSVSIPPCDTPKAVAVIGAAGYTGRELIRLILSHPQIRLVATFGSVGGPSGRTVSSEHPTLRGQCDMPIEPWTGLATSHPGELSAVFLATPHEVSDRIALELMDAGIQVIDLSGAFRLKDDTRHQQVYGYQRSRPGSAARALYAIPEFNRDGLANASLIACAGCYATAAQLSIRPLVDAGLLANHTVIVDAISGVSGAGRAPNARHLLSEVSHTAYGIPSHRHEPEMIEHSGVDILFTPHLAPVDRGILSTTHAVVRQGISATDIQHAFESSYAQARLVRILPEGTMPAMGAVVHSPWADLAWAFDAKRSRVRVFAAIDNLMKGASSQAIQCWNLANGMPDWLGLVASESMGSALLHAGGDA